MKQAKERFPYNCIWKVLRTPLGRERWQVLLEEKRENRRLLLYSLRRGGKTWETETSKMDMPGKGTDMITWFPKRLRTGDYWFSSQAMLASLDAAISASPDAITTGYGQLVWMTAAEDRRGRRDSWPRTIQLKRGFHVQNCASMPGRPWHVCWHR